MSEHGKSERRLRDVFIDLLVESRRGWLAGAFIAGGMLTLMAGMGINDLFTKAPATSKEVADTVAHLTAAGQHVLLARIDSTMDAKLLAYDASLDRDSTVLMDSLGVPMMREVVGLRRDMRAVQRQLKMTSDKVDERDQTIERRLAQITGKIESRDQDDRVLLALDRLETRMDQEEKRRAAEMQLLKDAMRRKGMKIDF